MAKKGGASFWRERARVFETPSWMLLQQLGLEPDDDLDVTDEYEDLRDDEDGLSNEDLGLCPHCGARDDDGCDSDCPGYLDEEYEE